MAKQIYFEATKKGRYTNSNIYHLFENCTNIDDGHILIADHGGEEEFVVKNLSLCPECAKREDGKDE
jgi:hypothetical protein